MRLTTVHSQPTPSWVKEINSQQAEKQQQSDINKEKKKITTKSQPQNNNQNKKSESKDQELNLREEQQTQKLRQRDSEVRQHELAHKTTGGRYAGNITYSYQQGPDGNRYAVGGEVGMDIQTIPGKPEKTVEKAETVKRAALAPAQPSAQDLKIAAKAARMKMEALAKLRKEEGKPDNSKQQNNLDELYNPSTPRKEEQISLIA